MPETKSKFLDRILEPGVEGARSFGKERQLTAQAFNLHVERKDGRKTEGLAWSHYAGYQWTDEGSHERLVVIFGMRAVEIEGQNLGVLVAEIRDGQLNCVRELTTRQATLLKDANTDGEPVISSIRTYPDFDEILKEIKGENDDQQRDTKRDAGRRT
jgi:hypothetical protein